MDLLVNATDKATGESLSDLERTNQAFVMVMSGDFPFHQRGTSKGRSSVKVPDKVRQMYALTVLDGVRDMRA